MRASGLNVIYHSTIYRKHCVNAKFATTAFKGGDHGGDVIVAASDSAAEPGAERHHVGELATMVVSQVLARHHGGETHISVARYQITLPTKMLGLPLTATVHGGVVESSI